MLVDVEAHLLPDPEHLLKTVQHTLDDANGFSAHHLRLRLANGPKSGRHEEEEAVAAILRLTPGASGSAHS